MLNKQITTIIDADDNICLIQLTAARGRGNSDGTSTDDVITLGLPILNGVALLYRIEQAIILMTIY